MTRRKDQELPTIIEDRPRRGPKGTWFDGDIRGGESIPELTRAQMVRSVMAAIKAHGIEEGQPLGEHEDAIREIAAILHQPERPGMVSVATIGRCRKGGHLMTPENTYIGRGKRECRQCRRERDLARKVAQ